MFESKIQLPVPEDFVFEPTVRSYGFYALPPNRFDSENKIFSRPLRCGNDHVVYVRITHPTRANTKIADNSISPLDSTNYLDITCTSTTKHLDDEEKKQITDQIVRMFRIDEDISDFHSKFPPAREIGFGRTFRSPTFFEDIVKTMTNCNVTFKNTKNMNRLLCECVGKDGAFPTPAELAQMNEEDLAKQCKVGYRANRIIRFARDVVAGKIDTEWFEQFRRIRSRRSPLPNEDESSTSTASDSVEITQRVKQKLLEIHGFGEFSANNVLQLLGRFDIIPADSETARYLREHHKLPPKAKSKEVKDIAKQAQKVFAPYAPYQFLVYWFELYEYKKRFSSTTTTTTTGAAATTNLATFEQQHVEKVEETTTSATTTHPMKTTATTISTTTTTTIVQSKIRMRTRKRTRSGAPAASSDDATL